MVTERVSNNRRQTNEGGYSYRYFWEEIETAETLSDAMLASCTAK